MAAVAEVIECPQRQYSATEVARILANSEADLADDDACLDVLVAHGVAPWNFSGNWMETKIEAHNTRTLHSLLQPMADPIEGESEGPGGEKIGAVERTPVAPQQNAKPRNSDRGSDGSGPPEGCIDGSARI